MAPRRGVSCGLPPQQAVSSKKLPHCVTFIILVEKKGGLVCSLN